MEKVKRMKISTKGRYGLRAMVDLAVNSAGDHVALKSIAERQDISENYLEQVFSSLRKSGLINSIKGAQGGYVLAKSAANITVGDILRILEGDLSVIDEKATSGGQDNKVEACIKSAVWDSINESINKVVDGITLEQLVEDYKKMASTAYHMFYI